MSTQRSRGHVSRAGLLASLLAATSPFGAAQQQALSFDGDDVARVPFTPGIPLPAQSLSIGFFIQVGDIPSGRHAILASCGLGSNDEPWAVVVRDDPNDPPAGPSEPACSDKAIAFTWQTPGGGWLELPPCQVGGIPGEYVFIGVIVRTDSSDQIEVAILRDPDPMVPGDEDNATWYGEQQAHAVSPPPGLADAIATSQYSLVIGEGFVGLLDDVTLWDVPLLPVELYGFASDPVPCDIPRLVGHWRFDGPDAELADDWGPKGLHLQLGTKPDEPDVAEPQKVPPLGTTPGPGPTCLGHGEGPFDGRPFVFSVPIDEPYPGLAGGAGGADVFLKCAGVGTPTPGALTFDADHGGIQLLGMNLPGLVTGKEIDIDALASGNAFIPADPHPERYGWLEEMKDGQWGGISFSVTSDSTGTGGAVLEASRRAGGPGADVFSWTFPGSFSSAGGIYPSEDDALLAVDSWESGLHSPDGAPITREIDALDSQLSAFALHDDFPLWTQTPKGAVFFSVTCETSEDIPLSWVDGEMELRNGATIFRTEPKYETEAGLWEWDLPRVWLVASDTSYTDPVTGRVAPSIGVASNEDVDALSYDEPHDRLIFSTRRVNPCIQTLAPTAPLDPFLYMDLNGLGDAVTLRNDQGTPVSSEVDLDPPTDDVDAVCTDEPGSQFAGLPTDLVDRLIGTPADLGFFGPSPPRLKVFTGCDGTVVFVARSPAAHPDGWHVLLCSTKKAKAHPLYPLGVMDFEGALIYFPFPEDGLTQFEFEVRYPPSTGFPLWFQDVFLREGQVSASEAVRIYAGP